MAQHQATDLRAQPIQRFDCADGGRLLRIHYSADPDKRSMEWKKKASEGMPSDEWRREMELDETIWDGEPVFNAYEDAVHCPAYFLTNDIPLFSGSFYFGSLDVGMTIHPAGLLWQITGPPHQVHVLAEVVPDGSMTLEEFSPWVVQESRKVLPQQFNDVYWWADETIRTRSGHDGRTGQKVIFDASGLMVRPVSNAWAPRLAAGDWMLRNWIDEETPRLYISGKRCPILRQALQGGYRYRDKSTAPTEGPERQLLMPLKNVFSHVADAFQYGAVRIKQLIELGPSEFMRELEQQRARSRAGDRLPEGRHLLGG